MSDSPKYNRTFHLPFSPGLQNDDRRVDSVDHWLKRSIMITEKMDGSNLCFERDNIFSRSHSKYPVHESFNAAKAEWARVHHDITAGLQVFGEWCWAKHSIHYTNLPGFFMIFGVRDLRNTLWWDWSGVECLAADLGFPTVPIITENIIATSERSLQNAVETSIQSRSKITNREVEGIVVRPDRWHQCFRDSEFQTKVCKWVRKDHIQTDEHWMNLSIVRNSLA